MVRWAIFMRAGGRVRATVRWESLRTLPKPATIVLRRPNWIIHA